MDRDATDEAKTGPPKSCKNGTFRGELQRHVNTAMRQARAFETWQLARVCMRHPITDQERMGDLTSACETADSIRCVVACCGSVCGATNGDLHRRIAHADRDSLQLLGSRAAFLHGARIGLGDLLHTGDLARPWGNGSFPHSTIHRLDPCFGTLHCWRINAGRVAPDNRRRRTMMGGFSR